MSKYYTAQEKAAYITWKLAHGEVITYQDLIDEFGITRQAAVYIMDGLSRVTPITKGEQGRWRKFNLNHT